MEVVPKEVAEKDIERFLTALRVDPIKRKKMKESIATCVEFVMYGMLVVNDNNELEYKLLESIEDKDGEVVLSEIKFKNKRVRLDSLEKVKNATEESYMRELISLMTDADKLILKKTTLEDMGYLEKIGMFFLPAQ